MDNYDGASQQLFCQWAIPHFHNAINDDRDLKELFLSQNIGLLTTCSRLHTCSSRSSPTSVWITCLPPGELNTPLTSRPELIATRTGCPVSPPSTPTTWPATAGARWSPFSPWSTFCFDPNYHSRDADNLGNSHWCHHWQLFCFDQNLHSRDTDNLT